MSDLIDRQQVIEAIDSFNVFQSRGDQIALEIKINELPSAELESFKWCDTCKEYDQEKHCCHRFTKVIRDTVDEMKVVKCKDCKYAEYMSDVQSLWCTECGNGRTVAPYDFCSYGERRTDG